MPSSSSSEEDLSKFKDVADSNFFNNSLFQNEQASSAAVEKSQVVALPSLRNLEDEDQRRTFHNDLRVRPSFQKHVAKHLSKLLDSQFDLNEQCLNDIATTNQTRNILKAKRAKNTSSIDVDEPGGVRLFGASAVFLSNLNIVPHSSRRRKRGRKVASFSSDSSSEESDSDMEKLSSAAVSSNWILNGAATKGWAIKEGKVERCSVNKSGILISFKDDLARGYESLNEMSSNNNKYSKPSDLHEVKDDLAVEKLHKKEKSLHLESELAASFSSVVSIGSDSQADASNKSKKKKKKKRKRAKKDHYSEDATTETTEVEDALEERKKKVKKSKKKSKRRRTEAIEAEKLDQVKKHAAGLIEECPRKKKKSRKKVKQEKQDQSFLKKKSHHSNKILKKPISKKKMSKKVLHLAEDLSKLMMTQNDTS